jgi:putative endonuclease
MTSSVGRRLNEHNSGKVKSTRGFKPWKLFFFEEYETRGEARKREVFLKTGFGRSWIKKKWLLSSTG